MKAEFLWILNKRRSFDASGGTHAITVQFNGVGGPGAAELIPIKESCFGTPPAEQFPVV
jgi:hypothetical protein